MLTNVYDTVRGEIQLVNGDWYVTKVVILSRSGKTRPQTHALPAQSINCK
jgi:hypothetical protein